MGSKEIVNNQITEMRKCVKQAKVQILRDLVKAKKLLEKRRCPENKREKFKRKEARIVEEILELKKIVIDDISKKALSESKDWKKVLSQKDLTSTEKIKARLISHKAIQKSLNKFYAENANWEMWLPPIMKMWELKRKTVGSLRQSAQNEAIANEMGSEESIKGSEDGVDLSDNEQESKLKENKDEVTEKSVGKTKKVQKSKPQLKKRKSLQKKKEPKIPENIEESNEEISMESDDKIEATSSNHVESSDGNENSRTTNVLIKPKKPKLVENDKISEDLKDVVKKAIPEKTTKKERKTAKIKYLNFDELKDRETIDDEISEDEIDDSSSIEGEICTDPFFMTTSSNKKNDQFESVEERFVPSDEEFLEKPKPKVQEKVSTKIKDVKNKLTRNKPNLKVPVQVEEQSETKPVTKLNEHLHPSWEAKKKQKQQIVAFQGSKIKFED